MQHRRELRRIAISLHMHIHRERLVAQQVIVQRRDLDFPRGELAHDGVDLIHGQHEVAHDHAVISHFLESEPTPERKTGFQLDAVECDLQIGAWQTDPVDATRRRRAGLAKRLADARLPIVIGSNGETGHSR
jgi:hypothetical protein